MKIRLLQSKDVEAVSNLIIEGLRYGGPGLQEKIQEEVKSLHGVNFNKYYIAELKNEIVGVLQVIDYEEVIHISVLSILKTHQNQNLGSELLNSVLDKLNKITQIQVYSNLNTIKFYEKQGFQFVDSVSLYEIMLNKYNLDLPRKDIIITSKLMDWMLDLDKLATGYSRRSLFEFILDNGAKILSHGKSGLAILHNNTIGPVIAINFDMAINLIKKSIELGGKYISILDLQLSHFKNSEKIILRELEKGHKMHFGDNLNKNSDLEIAIHSFGFG